MGLESRPANPFPGRAAKALIPVLCLLPVLCGCHPDSSEPIRMTGWLASPVEADLTRSLVEAFEREHPGFPVHYEPITASYMDKLLLMLGTGTAPDVVMVESFWIPQFAAYGLLLPLDEFVRRDPGLAVEDFEPALLEAFLGDGRLYALPKDYSTLALFFNPAMFAEAGLHEPPATWEEFAADARRLTRDSDGDGLIDRYGYAHAEMLEYSLPFVWQNRGEYFDGAGRPVFTEPAFAEALEFLQRLKLDGYAVLPTDVGAAWSMDAFGRERAAMAISGLWAVNFMKDTFPETPYRVAPLPAGKERASVAFVVGYAIPKTAREPERAWRLLRYLTGPKGARLWDAAGVGLPPRRSVVRELDLAQDSRKRVFIESLPYSRPWRFRVNQRVLDETESALQAIFITGAPVRPTLEDLRRSLMAAHLLQRPEPAEPR
jgi:multiple sugar transport system substrate-binding protein